MRERDKRDHDRIKKVMEFALNDDFWKYNILSMGKLRKQFDRLEMQMKGGSNKKNKMGNDTYPSSSTPAYSQEKFTRGDWELLRQAKMDLEKFANEDKIYKWLCRLPPGMHSQIALHLRRVYPADNSGNYDKAKRRYELEKNK